MNSIDPTQISQEQNVPSQQPSPTKEERALGVENIRQVVMIRNRYLRHTLRVLVWLWFATVVILFVFNNRIVEGTLEAYSELLVNPEIINKADVRAGLFMNATGVLAAGMALIIFQMLTQKIPLIFTIIWKRNIITISSQTPSELSAESMGVIISPEKSNGCEKSQYQSFLLKLEELLNHPGQWVVGFLCAILMFTWEMSPRSYVSFIGALLDASFWIGIVDLFLKLLEFLLAYMIGLLIWRMVILGVTIWRLGKVFKLNPQLGHPDACGGLEPLGNLCLYNALIVSIAGVFLGSWIFVASIPEPISTDPLYSLWDLAMAYKVLFSWLIWIPIAVAAISFFVPLRSIHRAMQANLSSKHKQIEKLAEEITKIETIMVDQADTLDQKQADEMNRKLKTLQEIYERNRRLPVWPFNLKTLAKFASSQLLPILAALGLSDDIAGVLQAILQMFS